MPDFNAIVKEVKSVLRPGIVVPKDKEADPIGYRIAELGNLIKKLAEVNAQQGKDIAKINNMLIGLFEDLQKMKTEGSDQGATQTQAAPEPAAKTKAAPASDADKEQSVDAKKNE